MIPWAYVIHGWPLVLARYMDDPLWIHYNIDDPLEICYSWMTPWACAIYGWPLVDMLYLDDPLGICYVWVFWACAIYGRPPVHTQYMNDPCCGRYVQNSEPEPFNKFLAELRAKLTENKRTNFWQLVVAGSLLLYLFQHVYLYLNYFLLSWSRLVHSSLHSSLLRPGHSSTLARTVGAVAGWARSLL